MKVCVRCGTQYPEGDGWCDCGCAFVNYYKCDRCGMLSRSGGCSCPLLVGACDECRLLDCICDEAEEE